MTNLIGQSLGRYHILEQLGEGGMATVYKAFDTRLEADVAVKVIRTERLAPEILQRSLKRFEREAKALARLTHPNIVKVTDYGEHEGKPYLVMPFLPGGTLKDHLKQGPLTWQESLRLLLPIAEALDFAHSQNMIHRDVKPSNILLTQRGQPMLTDFGIAKILDLEETADLTGTGMGIGTPEYMAPEQWTGKTSALSDQYSLGVVVYEMLTGRKPYTADTPAAILLKQATEPLPRPSTFSRDLPEKAEKLLIKALAKNPDDRYANMGDFAAAFEVVLSGTSVPSKPQPARPREKTRDPLATIDQSDSNATINQNEETTVNDSPTIGIQKPATKTARKLAPSGILRYWPVAVGGILIVFIVAIVSSLFIKPVETNSETETALLAFTGTSGSRVGIYTYDKDNNTIVPKDVGNGDNWDPALSASGNLYFTSNRDDGKAEIYRLIDGKIERVTDTPGRYESWGPALGISGNIYFTSNRDDGKAEIYRLIDGKIERVTDTPGRYESWGPALGVSGNIYFTSNRDDGKAEIYRLINGKIERVTNTPGQFESWAPVIRGGDVYFTSNRFSRKLVYVLKSPPLSISNITSWTNLYAERQPGY